MERGCGYQRKHMTCYPVCPIALGRMLLETTNQSKTKYNNDQRKQKIPHLNTEGYPKQHMEMPLLCDSTFQVLHFRL